MGDRDVRRRVWAVLFAAFSSQLPARCRCPGLIRVPQGEGSWSWALAPRRLCVGCPLGDLVLSGPPSTKLSPLLCTGHVLGARVGTGARGVCPQAQGQVSWGTWGSGSRGLVRPLVGPWPHQSSSGAGACGLEAPGWVSAHVPPPWPCAGPPPATGEPGSIGRGAQVAGELGGGCQLLGFLSFGRSCWGGLGPVPHSLPGASLQSGPGQEAAPPASGRLLRPGGLQISGVQFPTPTLPCTPIVPRNTIVLPPRSEVSFSC